MKAQKLRARVKQEHQATTAPWHDLHQAIERANSIANNYFPRPRYVVYQHWGCPDYYIVNAKHRGKYEGAHVLYVSGESIPSK